MSVQYIGHKTGPCIKLGRKQMRNTDKYKKVVMRERMMNDKHDDNDEGEGENCGGGSNEIPRLPNSGEQRSVHNPPMDLPRILENASPPQDEPEAFAVAAPWTHIFGPETA